MKTLQRLKRVAQLIFDGEIYLLAWIAVKNLIKRPHVSGSAPQQPVKMEQKKAKAMNSE